MKAFFTVAACFISVSQIFGQTIEVSPSRVMIDEPATILLHGLSPGERITVQAKLVDGADEPWSSSADFMADAQGTVDATKQAPVAGSYKEVSAMGLVWSMRPTQKGAKIYRFPKDLAPQTIEFRLVRNGQALATAQLEQLEISEGIKRVTVQGTLHGVLFEPVDGGPHAGVLVLGGSGGGLPLHQAAWLASRGFAAFALAYFRYEDLPQRLEAIPLEYFGAALNWMMKRPEISSDHIAVLGVSRGGELVLQLGSMYPQIKAVIAYVPSNVLNQACCGDNSMPYAWTWKGAPLAYVNFRNRSNADAVRAATIRVENTHGPILLISGQDDGVWESSRMADEVVARLKSAHFTFKVEHLKYHHAGHMAGHAGIVPAWHEAIEHPVSGREENLGGTAEGDALSSLDATPKVLDFLRESLGTSAPEKLPTNPSK